MRKISVTIGILFIMFVLCVSPVFADLSFEQGLSDWTVEHRQDTWPGTLHEYTNDVVTDRYSDGSKSVRLGAKIVGDYSPCCIVVGNGDQTQTIVWKGPYDLTRGLFVSVDMADIQRAGSHFSWGWGMEADLILSDGVNEARSLLWDYHEENTGKYGPSGLEDNLYTSVITGTDGFQWFRYRVPLTAGKWNSTDFGGGPLAALDLSHVMVGVVYAAESWNSQSQTLWANGLVDNLRIKYNIPIQIGIKVTPSTLNIKSKGGENSVTVHSDFPFDQVDINSLKLNGIPVTLAQAAENGNLMCKFDRQALIAIVAPSEAVLTLSGLDTDGVSIFGSDTIRVINPGK